MDAPADMPYVLVVSQESVRIDFLIAYLNDLDLFSANVQNVYLNAPPCKKD